MTILTTLKFLLRHPLNKGKPLSTMARFVQWQIKSRIQNEVEYSWIAGSKLIVKRGMKGATGNIYCGLHEYVDMAFVLHMLRAEDLFLDVGANVGSYTVLASAVCGARSISIEPDPITAQYLKRNIFANRMETRCALIQTAVGAKDGTVSFTVGKDTVNQIAANNEKNTQVVRIARLDCLLDGNAPTVMKMDVEGHEMEALRGAVLTLKSMELKAIIIENTSSEVVSLLSDNGFKRYFYDPEGRKITNINGLFSSSNGLFIREKEFVMDRLRKAETRSVLGKIL
jgi:FkbM family methyltransferase